ncbi:MAG: (2Fe-2S)-binding protein [Chloroflexi bacterium]|nr:(2Fe-2S)-binding protein [Chloroflexota bacterium]
MDVELILNGEKVRVPVRRHSQTLLELLRDEVGQTDVKEGCGKGDCGACNVLLDGKAVNSCLVLALQADGCSVVTLRGLGSGEQLHPIQTAMIEHGGIQCGFCTPGMVISLAACLQENPSPSRAEIREAISGNLCRCTGYHKIVDAAESAAAEMRGEAGDRARARLL